MRILIVGLNYAPEPIGIGPSIMSALPARLGAMVGGAKPWLHLQDFEVDAAFATRIVRGKWLARVLLAIERAVLRSAHRVSSTGPRMVARLVEKGVAPERTYELRNWTNALAGEPGEPGFRERWDLGTRQVVLYAGNLGAKQGAELIVDAARRLARREDLVFVICGEGPHLAALKARAAGLDNLRFHPLQPAERLLELLELAAIHLLPQTDAAAWSLVSDPKLSFRMVRHHRPLRPLMRCTVLGGGAGEGLVTKPLSGSPKVERLHDMRFGTWRQAKDEVMEWITFHNHRRLHSTPGYASPMAFEQQWLADQIRLAA